LRLNLEEVAFIKEAVANSTIKGSNAAFVAEVLEKLEKEFSRLYEKENK
jgi:hypothetical protein